MPKLTDDQARKLYNFARRLRDRLAVIICNEGALNHPSEAGELRAVCDLLNDVKPVFHDQRDGPPPGVDERRRTVRH